MLLDSPFGSVWGTTFAGQQVAPMDIHTSDESIGGVCRQATVAMQSGRCEYSATQHTFMPWVAFPSDGVHSRMMNRGTHKLGTSLQRLGGNRRASSASIHSPFRFKGAADIEDICFVIV